MKRIIKIKTLKNLLKLSLLILGLFVGGYLVFTWLQVRG